MKETTFTIKVSDWYIESFCCIPFYKGGMEYELIDNGDHPEANENINNYETEIAEYMYGQKVKCPALLSIVIKEFTTYDNYSGATEGDSELVSIDIKR